MLSLDRLRYLVEVHRRGSIGAAAGVLHITPSAVSQQLKLLSKSVGCDVVEALPTGSRCTAVGLVLVDHAMKAMTELELAEDAVRLLNRQSLSEISLACFPSAVGSLLPNMISGVNGEYPKLKIKFEILGSREGLNAIISGGVDIALIAIYPGGDPLPRGIQRTVLGHDELHAVVPVGHRLCSASAVSVHDLAEVSLLLEGENSPSCRTFLDACHSQGVVPVIKTHSPDAGVSLAMAAENLGVAVMPTLAIGQASTKVVCRPLTPSLVRTILLVCRPGMASSPSVDALASFGRQACEMARMKATGM